ncbi:MAG TPA: cytochrome c3 family protein [Bryobacteraceae bacterium]|nr:cytochrome c3 family protein [Bryobacteraceae bacterium]
MSESIRTSRKLVLLLLSALPLAGQSGPGKFSIHRFHRQTLGSLECNLCHVPVSTGSVELKRPGHEECGVCHSTDFESKARPLICKQCHSGAGTANDLLPFPSDPRTRSVLKDFSHARHMDGKVRIDPVTHFRSDCTFCHSFASDGARASFPAHTQCAACHSKPGVAPRLSGSVGESVCEGCHAPDEHDSPGATAASYSGIRFSHRAHFQWKEAFQLDCTTCHSSIPSSRGLADATLPAMVDCVACHGTSKKIAAEFRMSNCRTCHVDNVQGVAPASHSLSVKPPSHHESFRIRHADAAAEPGAKCFACHQNVLPTLQATNQCAACHQVMRPASHTARWKDDLHGEFAAIDRATCATCHAADYCVRCHNELPRSHQPLPLFKAGAHAQLAMLNQRACLTCHTFQNTCTKCHARALPR